MVARKQAPGKASKEPPAPASKRSYLRQADVPNASLDEALRVPQALYDHYAGKPTPPLYLAKALQIDPKGSQLRVITGAANAFGLMEGGAQAATVSVTELARRIIRPKVDDEDIEAKREAVLKPRVFGEFLRQYDGHPFPRPDIAKNVLEDMGVPRDKVDEVLERIDASARSVGFIEEIRGKFYVSLRGSKPAALSATPPQHEDSPDSPVDGHTTQDVISSEDVRPHVPLPPIIQPQSPTLLTAIADDQRRKRVFITHGKDRAFVEPIKKLLEFGELEPVVSVERSSVSKPVPEKVMDDMRKAGAAIIHVETERTLHDNTGVGHEVLNPNVLIEIGAAMAFYGRRFILLVRDGVQLPSNLQGLFEVRYSGDVLDATATIKLLEAIKDIKNYRLPTETEAD